MIEPGNRGRVRGRRVWASLADLPEKEGNKGVARLLIAVLVHCWNCCCCCCCWVRIIIHGGEGSPSPASYSLQHSLSLVAYGNPSWAALPWRKACVVGCGFLGLCLSPPPPSRLLAWSISQSSPSLTLLYICAVSLVVRLLFLLWTHRIYYRRATFS